MFEFHLNKRMKTSISLNFNSGSNRVIENVIGHYSNIELSYTLFEEHENIKIKLNLSYRKIK